MRPFLRLLCVLAVPALALWLTCVPGSAALTVWPTYHLDQGRSGNDASEPSFRGLHSAWTSATLDGAVYAEPLIDGTTVIVVTENDSVYAFDAATGAHVWSTDPVSLGTPRTTNFPCGDINPLGITGTPVIDGGYLYVLEEVESNANGQYRFELAKLKPSNGSVVWNHDVTPPGMNTDYEQERSALAVSNGNVVVVWGGLSGDCGPYHGIIETVSESSGAIVNHWSDTTQSGDREGGIWAPSGPAVDSAGDIFVSTGNGQQTNITQYAGDYGDSVLRFSPSLSLTSFFAPAAPESWANSNSDDADLGSVGPSLLPNGLLFAIGKGGIGYLLNAAQLPNNSNPGGGENTSAQVCTNTNDAAFGGLAVSGSTVYVPCEDGIAAVAVGSSTYFQRIWYQHTGGSAPILAGGLVWTADQQGGSTLYGLNPSNGAVVAQLSLPASTEHFATPASAQQRLFIAAGNQLVAFAPPAPPAAPAAGGYMVDGYGGIHPYGGASAVYGYSYWPGWDIARGIVMRPDRASGFVLDGYGGLSPYGLAEPVSGPYWPGWDIARAAVVDPCDSSGNSGYVLDGQGGIHPFGGAPAVDVQPNAYWRGWDIARAIAVNPCASGVVSGYMLDGEGGIHAFWQHGTTAVTTPTDGAYWPGWDIARGIVVTARGQGVVVDGQGGVHAFGGAPAPYTTHFVAGQNVVRGLTFNASLGGGYTLDEYGALHPWWLAHSGPISSPSGQTTWSFPIARGAAE